jgi:cyclopropane fatty-acyl-phospholipid synthase-like methyltransferase
MSRIVSNKIEVQLIKGGYNKSKSGIYKSGNTGYWSNLDKDENENFIKILECSSPREAVREVIPDQENQIFSEKREAALELLDIQKGNVCIDYGCMWGVLSVGMAKRGATVIAIDQTQESLEFLNARKSHENLNAILIIQDDIRKVDLKEISDYAIINGVLEWVPEFGDVELKKFFGKKMVRENPVSNPRNVQINFLKKVKENLKNDGKLLLSIENRYDYTQFIGKKDPHVNLFFTSIFPRKFSNIISRIFLKRPYLNYIYSFEGLRELITEAGFKNVDLYMVFPHYHMPELILPYKKGIGMYKKYYSIRDASLKRKIVWVIEYALMRFFKAKFFSPSIIAIAKK